MKYCFIFLVTVYVATATQFSYAQTTTASTSDTGILDTVLDGVGTITNTVQEQITGPAEEQTILSARAQERITNLAANISNRLDAIIARLEQISSRLDSRLIKLQSEGKDTTTARNSLTLAQRDLNAAKSEMQGIDAAVLKVVGSSDPKAEWRNVRSTFIRARDSIRSAHTNLRSTVAAIKQLSSNNQ
jgi:hypothetical protein